MLSHSHKTAVRNSFTYPILILYQVIFCIFAVRGFIDSLRKLYRSLLYNQIFPVTVITAVPGVTETVPSVFVANVAAGTSIAPAVVSNTPVASL